MARPQEYNRDLVLDGALRLFWSQGYEATKLPQLLEATGISRSSLYASFGDKRQLFMECLQRYSDSMEEVLAAIERSDDPAWAVREYAAISFGGKGRRRLRSGCLIVNTLLEFEDRDRELSALAEKHMKRSDRAFHACFRRAGESGRLRDGLSPDALAKTLATLRSGIQVHRRAGLSDADAMEILECFIEATGLDAPGAATPARPRDQKRKHAHDQ